MISKKALALLAILAASLSVAACRPNQSLEGQAKDAQIKTQVKAKLASQVDASTLTAIEVNVTNGVVTLAGPAHSSEESSRIAETARGVEGVASVQNAMVILAPEKSTTPAATGSTGSR